MSPISPEDIAGAARQYLALVDMLGETYVHALDSVLVAGARISATVPRACAELINTKPITIRCDHRGLPHAVEERGAHEVGHFALWLAGHGLRHGEAAADAVGRAIRMPTRAIDRKFDEVGLNPAVLAAAWPLVRPSEVFTRVSQVRSLIAVLRVGRTRTVVANDNAAALEANLGRIFEEERLVDEVTQTQRLARGNRAVAAPFIDPGANRVGIVILVDP